jgi:uncharacterized protein (TIGR02145 family)
MKKVLSLTILILVCSCSTSSDDNGNSNTTGLPILTTAAVLSNDAATAESGGSISSDGGAVITARGVCWNTNANPTVALTTKTTDGEGTGAFTSNITGLIANTTYYVRAYATNIVGTAYGNEISFTASINTLGINIAGPSVTDIDGNTYQSVSNCGLTFTKRNLNVSSYNDGTPIPQVTDPTQWANLTTGAWCFYENSAAQGTRYGKLYNWYAVAGIYDSASASNPTLRKKLAPTGWHIPSEAEWTQLIDCLGGEFAAGGKMKAIGTYQTGGGGLWNYPNEGATNESGFTGLPGGYRGISGSFTGIYSFGTWWSSSENDTTNAWQCVLFYIYGFAAGGDGSKPDGFSVRCIRD